MLALWNVACSCIVAGLEDEENYKVCANSLDLMEDLADSRPDIFSDGQKVVIARIGKIVARRRASELEAENVYLRRRCDDLQKELKFKTSIGNIVHSASGLLLTISAILPRQMSFVKTIGKLVVSDNVFSNESSVIRNN